MAEQTQEVVLTETAPVITTRKLLEAGVHFGHKTGRWNPKMKKYIYTARNGIYIIDLEKSASLTFLESQTKNFSFLDTYKRTRLISFNLAFLKICMAVTTEISCS